MNNEKRWAGRAVLVALGIFALVLPAPASQHHPQPRTAPQIHQRPVAYENDGTPIATGAPRRLSALAMGGSAWATYHDARGKRHRQQIAKLQAPVR